jgi:hypothetical protein
MLMMMMMMMMMMIIIIIIIIIIIGRVLGKIVWEGVDWMHLLSIGTSGGLM